MSTIALTFAALYLFKKKYEVQQKLDEQVTIYNEAAEPATPMSTQMIRGVQRTVPMSETHQDMNLQDLNMADVNNIKRAEKAQADEVVAYENPVQSPEIQGVYLSFERGF